MTQTKRQSKTWQRVATASILGPILLICGTVTSGLLRPGYSPTAQPISDLGIDSRFWILNISLVVCGLSVMVLAAALYRLLPRLAKRRLLAVLFSLFGICFAMAGIFPEPGPNGPLSIHGLIHFLFGFMIGMTTLTVALFIASAQLRKLKGWQTYGRYTLLTAITMVALVPSTFVFFNPSSPLESWGIGGLMERLLFADFLLWFIVTGLRLSRSSAK